jgi:hypothetical protein
LTFTEIRTEILNRMNLVGTDASTRVGSAINRHNARICAELGLDAIAYVQRTSTTSIGTRTLAFSNIEKIDRIRDATTSASLRFLTEDSFHDLKSMQPGSGAPNKWAVQSVTASTVTVVFDNTPDAEYTIQADGQSTTTDLSGSDVPAIPKSFHDILTWYVLAEEYLRKEKVEIAKAYEIKATELLRALQFKFADSATKDTRQGDGVLDGAGGSGSGSGSELVEVGTWTPAITGSGGSSGQVYATRSGRYIKIGKHVTAWARITMSTLGTITGNVLVSGLPETAAAVGDHYGGVCSYWTGMGANFVCVSAYVGTGNTTASLVGTTTAATGVSALVQANLSNSTDLMLTFTYEAVA